MHLGEPDSWDLISTQKAPLGTSLVAAQGRLLETRFSMLRETEAQGDLVFQSLQRIQDCGAS